jgi:hypothetical protein
MIVVPAADPLSSTAATTLPRDRCNHDAAIWAVAEGGRSGNFAEHVCNTILQVDRPFSRLQRERRRSVNALLYLAARKLLSREG